MLRFVILSLALIALINSSNIPKTTATPPAKYQNDKKFVQTACNSTTYPTMCYNALSSYSSTIKSDPIKLCLTSLRVNLKSAKSASSIVSSLLKKVASSPEVPNILKDCLKEMKDTADELKQVIAEIINTGKISKAEIKRKLETWASSTLTEMTTCMDKFKEAKVNAEIKKVKKAVSELSMTTNNTLALMTSYLRY
ncbi:hypothetical protein N665_0043s0133 [Sinapis alba]|nr:hypothetical protein N665_0043s0133 [Sinapis alba]